MRRAVTFGVMVLAQLAPAAAAEDTLQDLLRCSQIPDPGQRLGCYDNLMPKLRAQRAAAPSELSKDDQISLFGLNLSNLFGSSRQTTPQQFGEESVPPPRAPLTPTVPGASAVSSAQGAIAQPSAPVRVTPIDRISAGVTEYSMTPLGRFVVFLDNGQVWRQLDGDTGRPLFRRNAADNSVTISRGALGSYNLQLNGTNASFKVTRLK